ncbi:tetratricopeptide repeat protein [Sphingomonas xanthus]|uniref:Tetratricopeptide repeat protein n=1 Tax=Sphingomonas xanthus TaxID=2594473 RepID=A0A516IQK8_9SPHN|nr:tetratricopeptide repeat protein [Sphingomonas xanthus]QDP19176.1 tetratricopeptide repeat protein [Sphingomonas xanthus]
MALTPDTSESFVREVDENLRRDQMRDAAKAYGKWIVAAVVVFLAVVGGYLYWQNRQREQAIADGETMSAALDKVGAGDAAGAAKDLEPLAASGNDLIRATSKLTRAALALQQNDRQAASRIYAEVAADTDLPQPYRDMALLRGTMTDYDQLKPDEVISRLAPLVEPGKPFFGSAGELTGMAMLAKGDRSGAGQLFARIAADQQVPESIRTRAVQVAGSLGVDASASLPTAQ